MSLIVFLRDGDRRTKLHVFHLYERLNYSAVCYSAAILLIASCASTLRDVDGIRPRGEEVVDHRLVAAARRDVQDRLARFVQRHVHLVC